MAEKPESGMHEDIVAWIRKLRFKKRLFGGIDEDDVLKKLEELNRLYEVALLNERARYEALLKEKGGGSGND